MNRSTVFNIVGTLAFGLGVGLLVAVILFGAKDIDPIFFWLPLLAGGWGSVLCWVCVTGRVARGASP